MKAIFFPLQFNHKHSMWHLLFDGLVAYLNSRAYFDHKIDTNKCELNVAIVVSRVKLQSLQIKCCRCWCCYCRRFWFLGFFGHLFRKVSPTTNTESLQLSSASFEWNTAEVSISPLASLQSSIIYTSGRTKPPCKWTILFFTVISAPQEQITNGRAQGDCVGGVRG